MSVRGSLVVAGVEWSKLSAQLTVRLALAACVASPFAFAAAMRMQSAAPTDTLFGRSIADSGLALPLVVLGFAAFWALPVIASLVAGDMFAADDRYGTWTTLLTRSRSRTELFAGKVVTAVSFSIVAVFVLGVSSTAAGILMIGRQPLINLSGVLLVPAQALPRIALAWVSVLPPTLGFAGLAALASAATRSSAAGIGLPVVACLMMQIFALVDVPETFRRLIITSAYGSWHGLLTEPPFYAPLVSATIVSVAYAVVCLASAYSIVHRRDI